MGHNKDVIYTRSIYIVFIPLFTFIKIQGLNLKLVYFSLVLKINEQWFYYYWFYF